MLLTAVLAVVLHLSITWSLRRVNIGDLGAFNHAMQGRVNADIVVSGSSRAFRHYDPRVLARITGLSVFNLGLNASQIDLQLGVFKEYLRQNKKPRILIQNLDIQSFILTKPGDIFDPARYIPYLGETEIYSTLDRIDGRIWRWRYLPLYAYATEDTTFTWMVGFQTAIGVGSREPCYDGFSPVEKSWSNDFDLFKRAHPNGIDVYIDLGGIATLKSLVELCRRENIRLILVYSPQYLEMIGLTRNRTEIFGLFASISQQNGINFLDYSRSTISENKENFYNSQHLNKRGAEMFSEDLAQRLVTLGVTAK